MLNLTFLCSLVDLSNVFKIRDGKSSYVFRTSRTSEKRALLASFREVSQELAARTRKQREDEHERRKSIWGEAFALKGLPELHVQ